MLGRVKLILVLVIAFLLGFCWLMAKPNQQKLLSKNNERLAKLPKVMLWAWERAENLKFIDPKTTGVAFLAKTISLKATELDIRSRFQPLEVPPDTSLVAVVRIETDRYLKPVFSLEQQEKVLEAIIALTKLKGVVGLQIDFDAKESERSFYRSLLVKLRDLLPSNYMLSITALASWAIYDNWVADLPIDEAVPMLFRMGADKERVLNYLAAKKDFTSQNTSTSFGISTDSELPWLPAERRVYIFAERSWSAELLNDLLQKVEIWQTK